MRQSMLLIGCVMGGIWLTGCRTDLAVSDVSHVAEHRVDGVPFRVRETHTLRVYKVSVKKPEDGPQVRDFKQIMMTHHPLPNPNHVFALNLRAGSFTGHDFKLALLPDSTLKVVSLKGTPKSEAPAQLLSDALGIAKQVVTLDDDVKAREEELRKAQLDKDKATFGDLMLYEETYRKLQVLCGTLKARLAETNGLSTDIAQIITPEEEAIFRGFLKTLDEQALVLGKPLPFPNPFQADLHAICMQLPGVD